jgi:hypothetical protein
MIGTNIMEISGLSSIVYLCVHHQICNSETSDHALTLLHG